MVSQTFLDLSAMMLNEGWSLNTNVEEVQTTMEDYFQQEYNLADVKEALDVLIANEAEQQKMMPNDFGH